MKWTWTLVGIMVSLLAGCKRNATLENALFVSGRIDGDSVDISSKIQGRVVNLTVREGDSVEAGQVIAWLESAQQEAIRDSQRARIVSGQRTVEELERDLGTYDEKVRQAELYTDQARADAPGQVQQAEANLAAAKAISRAGRRNTNRSNSMPKGTPPWQRAEPLLFKWPNSIKPRRR